jgi:CheY-like chemotaxis protein
MSDGKHILVVEDNLAAQKVNQFLFKKQGCTVDCVADGKEAVEMAKKNKYHGICMDIGLPTMDGVEACKAIREYETKNNLEQVPIIAVTANYSDPEIKRYLDAGMQEVLDKPLNQEKAIQFLSLCK